MSGRLVIVLVVAALIAAGGAVAAVLLPAGGTPASVYVGSPPPPHVFLPEFALRDYTGEIVQTDNVRGKVVILTFLETQCEEACPIVASQVASGLRLLGPAERQQVVALAISTHPGDDTPASVRRFLRSHRALGELGYLIGTEDQLRPVWEAFYVVSALDTGDADVHSAPVRIFDRSGEWVSTLHSGVDLTPQSLAADVTAALAEDGER